MPKAPTYLAAALAALLLGLLTYGAGGLFDALRAADILRGRADTLIATGQGAGALGPHRRAALIRVQDPGFASHGGVDFTTPGAGATTITQSLSKRLGFTRFRPGLGKIRQTGYALGLERRLSKDQILALWLDTVEMGEGPDGWMVGFFDASAALFARSPAELTEAEFLRLVAVLIAPGRFHLTGPDPALDERVARIERLLAGACAPRDHGDVWLEGCAGASDQAAAGFGAGSATSRRNNGLALPPSSITLRYRPQLRAPIQPPPNTRLPSGA